MLREHSVALCKRWQVKHCPGLSRLCFSPPRLPAALVCTANPSLTAQPFVFSRSLTAGLDYPVVAVLCALQPCGNARRLATRVPSCPSPGCLEAEHMTHQAGCPGTGGCCRRRGAELAFTSAQAMLPADESRSPRRRPILTANHGDLYCTHTSMFSNNSTMGTSQALSQCGKGSACSWSEGLLLKG